MRKSPTRVAQKITTCLQEHGELGFAALLVATKAPSSQNLSRTLHRLRRDGTIVRKVLDTTPPTTRYKLAAATPTP